jgi:hypothetical protein
MKRNDGLGSFVSFWYSAEYFQSSPRKRTPSGPVGMSQTCQPKTRYGVKKRPPALSLFSAMIRPVCLLDRQPTPPRKYLS